MVGPLCKRGFTRDALQCLAAPEPELPISKGLVL